MPLDAYYAMLSRYDGASFVLSDMVKGVYRRTADFLEQHIEKDTRVLDIGCAFGGLLSELQQRGFLHLAGLEYVEKNCTYLEKTLQVPAHRGGLGNLPKSLAGERFGLVILSGVLEHRFLPMAAGFSFLRPMWNSSRCTMISIRSSAWSISITLT